MFEMASYSITVGVLGDGQWRVELHRYVGDTADGLIGMMSYDEHKALPDALKVKITLIDMGDAVNPRARMLEGVGSRYDTPFLQSIVSKTDYTRQYFLHNLESETVAQYGFEPP